MNIKITPDQLNRAAVIYVRRSTMTQVMGNLESQRRQYDLARPAVAAGFRSVTVIDDDLGRSGVIRHAKLTPVLPHPRMLR